MRAVYIAGKLNADAVGYLKNVATMIRESIKVQRAGFAVLVPCLDLLMGIVAGDFEYPDYADNNMVWLERADAVYVLPDSEHSKGTQAEVRRAHEIGIPVYYKIEDLLESAIPCESC